MVNAQAVEAYLLRYKSGWTTFSGDPEKADKVRSHSSKAIYFPGQTTEEIVLITRANKTDTIMGSVGLMYTAYVGEEAQKNWQELLSELKLKEDSKHIEKITLSQEDLNWGKCMAVADKSTKNLDKLLSGWGD